MAHTIPDAWLCPITYTVMRDPVIAPDGRTYERVAICQWLRIHGTSPFTREAMREEDLIPNMAIRELIEEAMPSLSTDDVSFVPSTAMLERPIISPHKIIHCLVDRSGSMDMPIRTPGYEQDGFTRLDLVKHTILTLIHSLPSEYALSITAFDSSARTILEVTPMDVNGKSAAIGAIGGIRAGTTTNVWDGLRQVLSLSEDGSSPMVLMFTDGQSNNDPPRGVRETLRRYILERGIHPMIHTLGYSYDIDSRLLHSLADEYDGLFGFIPDCTMIGTVFINIISKIMEMTEGSIIAADVGYHTTPMCPPLVEYLLDETTTNERSSVPERMIRIEELKEVIREIPVTTDFTEEYKNSLLVDIEDPEPDKGQIGKAVSNEEWFRRWGAHYLRSLHLAHRRGVCVNFKDASLQNYRTNRFSNLQDRMESIFVSLPSPEPSASPLRRRGVGRHRSVPSPLAAGATPMSVYYDDSAGCFTGDTLVLTRQGGSLEYRSISSLSPGDVVATTSDSVYAYVRFVIKYESLTTDVCSLDDDLHITKYHPVRSMLGGEWEFPKDIVAPEKTTITLYNLVLTSGHMVRCKGYECVTLGHSLKDNDVVAHEYFGTDAVVDDIVAEHVRQGGGGIYGNVIVRTLRVRRNPETGLIVGYVFNESD